MHFKHMYTQSNINIFIFLYALVTVRTDIGVCVTHILSIEKYSVSDTYVRTHKIVCNFIYFISNGCVSYRTRCFRNVEPFENICRFFLFAGLVIFPYVLLTSIAR